MRRLSTFGVGMHLVYVISATVGCALIGIQVVLQLLGMGGDVDTHFDGDASADLDGAEGESNFFFGILSFKSVTAFFAFFGLTGLACDALGIKSEVLSVVLSILSGIAAAFVVMLLMRGLTKLHATGTPDLEQAVGEIAKVYLRIPARDQGKGKITVVVAGQERELDAITNGPEIPTGAQVKVLRKMAGETFEVERA